MALDLDGGRCAQARIGARRRRHRPWRAREAEAALDGQAADEASGPGAPPRRAFAGAVTHGDNAFKPELGRRTLVRALLQAAAMEV